MEGGERSVVSHQDERTADRACSAEGDLTEVEGVQPDPLEPGHEPAPIPHFRLPPTDPAIRPLGEAKPDLTQASRALRETFTPTRPKKHRNRAFAGRYRIMERVIAAVEEDRAHVVIFGDRGVGKSSLVNILAETAGEAGYLVLRCACSSDLTFEEMFRRLLRNVPRRYLDPPERSQGAGMARVDTFEGLLPEGRFGATELTEALLCFVDGHAIFVIDEYDCVVSGELTNHLAETIKSLSDASARITLIIVGVAHTAEELIGWHPSIERNVSSIHVPLMRPDELSRVIQVGERESGIRFNERVRVAIVQFARGLPYYAQLLCLYSARQAIERGDTIVEVVDLTNAVERIVMEAHRALRTAYERAVRERDGSFMKDVVFAAATCAYDGHGAFTGADVAHTLAQSAGRTRHLLTLQKALSMLTTPDRGTMMERVSTLSGTKYKFQNHIMSQYVLLREAAARGLP